MLRRCLALVLLSLAACPGPVEQTCNRLLIDSTGIPSAGGFGGAGGSTGGNEDPIGLTGEPQRLTLFAQLTSCVSDVLRADVEIIGPDNLPLPPETTATPRPGSLGAVHAELSFTPTQAGTYLVRVAFEPSLGVRSVTLRVAESHLDGGGVHLPLPASVRGGLWPLTADTLAYEPGAGRVELLSSDGGVTAFIGEQLVVVDTVLWSVASATSTLERRVFEDGGLRVTDRYPGFSSNPFPGLHDVDVALRLRTNGQLGVARAGVASPVSLTDPLPLPAMFFVEPSGKLFNTSAANLTAFVALEPGVAWRVDGFSNGLLGVSRPLASLDDPPSFALHHAAESFLAPTGGFERVPLWLPLPGRDVSVLVSAEGGGLTFQAWPRSAVISVGRHFLLLRDAGGTGVRLAPR